MAITLLLLTVVLAGVVTGQPDQDDFDGFGPNMMYHYEPALELPSPPPLPYIAGMPQPPPLPPPPPLLMMGPDHFPNMPNFHRRRHFPQPEYVQPEFLQPDYPQSDFPEPDFLQPDFLPEMPSVEEMASASPTPGGTYDAVVIHSTSKKIRTEDGKIKREGGSSMILNDNGNVTVDKIGDSPPEIKLTKEPPFLDFPPKFKHFKPMPPFMPPPMHPRMHPHMPPHMRPPHHFGGFPPHKPHFAFKKFDPDTIKNYEPKEGEHFTGTSSSSHSYSSNINGVKSSGGSVSATTNVDGDIEEQKMAFDKSDPKP